RCSVALLEREPSGGHIALRFWSRGLRKQDCVPSGDGGSMQTVDFYYDFSSTNSYFAAFMVPEICRRTGAAMRWLPLHSVFRGTGFDVMAMRPEKARHLWRDHARYAEATGLPFRRPSHFPIKTALALRCVLAVDLSGLCHDDGARADLSQSLFRAYWERD